LYPPIDTPFSPPIVGIAGQTNILSDPLFHVGHNNTMSVVADVDRAAAKMTTMGMLAIRRDTIAVVSTRGMVAGGGSITSSEGKGSVTAKDAHRLCLGIINDDNDHCSCRHPPPLCRVTIHCRPWSQALAADINVAATVRDNIPLSKIVVPIANTKEGEEGRERRVEGGGHHDCSREE
jgi:hypothetical protein